MAEFVGRGFVVIWGWQSLPPESLAHNAILISKKFSTLLSSYNWVYSRKIVFIKLANLMEWTAEAEARLKEIPFFVRPAARKKIEKFAQAAGESQITAEIYKQAKQQFGA